MDGGHFQGGSRYAGEQSKVARGSTDPAPDHAEAEKPALRDLPADIAFLAAFGVPDQTLVSSAIRAEELAISASDALLANGHLSDVEYARCLAMTLGLPFEDKTQAIGDPFHQVPKPDTFRDLATMVAVAPSRATEPKEDGSPPNAQPNSSVDLVAPDFHLAPNGRNLSHIRRWLSAWPKLSQRLSITSLRANREGLMGRAQSALLDHACNSLARRSSILSARSVVTPKQAVVLFLFAQLLLAGWLFASGLTGLVLHLLATSFYLGCVGVRLWAAMTHDPSQPLREKRTSDCDLPKYSVLVPLYDEASQIRALAKALDGLDWPKERLEIKLICEADDQPTLDAADHAVSLRGRTHFEVIRVPPSLPRTKPKVLNYALPVCVGRLITVYDAEDRPHPGQLREAHAAFMAMDQHTAVLQSPLSITNGHNSWFARMFAIEYSSLFDGLLPALSRARCFGPLGGTSNHFKRAALDHIGGWDPYNVTEDADLGVRLARAGLQFGTLSLPTFEAAPETASVWFGQRTRWFKGWMQTWLVHMRQPFRLWRQLGTKQILVFHLMITGMIVSALVHPLLWLGVFYYATQWLHLGETSLTFSALFYLDFASILLGYAAMAALALRTLPQRQMQNLAPGLIGLPLYWLCLSAAAWRALYELIRRPHHWDKTLHHDPLDHPLRRSK